MTYIRSKETLELSRCCRLSTGLIVPAGFVRARIRAAALMKYRACLASRSSLWLLPSQLPSTPHAVETTRPAPPFESSSINDRRPRHMHRGLAPRRPERSCPRLPRSKGRLEIATRLSPHLVLQGLVEDACHQRLPASAAAWLERVFETWSSRTTCIGSLHPMGRAHCRSAVAMETSTAEHEGGARAGAGAGAGALREIAPEHTTPAGTFICLNRARSTRFSLSVRNLDLVSNGSPTVA